MSLECKISTADRLWDVRNAHSSLLFFLILIPLRRKLGLREVKSFSQECTAINGHS